MRVMLRVQLMHDSQPQKSRRGRWNSPDNHAARQSSEPSVSDLVALRSKPPAEERHPEHVLDLLVRHPNALLLRTEWLEEVEGAVDDVGAELGILDGDEILSWFADGSEGGGGRSGRGLRASAADSVGSEEHRGESSERRGRVYGCEGLCVSDDSAE